MMKAKVTMQDGTDLVILGFSHANLDKLRAESMNGFISVKAADLGIDHDIMIFAGETEAVMMETMAEFIGPNTLLHISDKLKQ